MTKRSYVGLQRTTLDYYALLRTAKSSVGLQRATQDYYVLLRTTRSYIGPQRTTPTMGYSGLHKAIM